MHVFLEKFWMVIAILATLLTFYLIIIDGFEAAIYYVLITGLVWGMYLIRRGIRIRLGKMEEERKENSKKERKKKK